MTHPRVTLVVALFVAVCLGPAVMASSPGPGAQAFELRLGPALADSSQPKWAYWVGVLAESVESVAGKTAHPPVIVNLEGDESRRPITFGRVRRGDPPRIDLQVHPDATLPELLDDWRGFHEFAHLMIPFPGNDDIWFTEGVASYYQHLLQVRAGIIEPDEAWRRLAEGFLRGLNDFNGAGRTLRELSPDMWRERAFKRVYWTGAAYFLRVDLRLRRESDGRHSLDSVLGKFARCCMRSSGTGDAESLIERFGALSMPRVWMEEYTGMIDAPARPDVGEAMARLGIEISNAGVELLDNPEARRLRRTIANGSAMRSP